MADSKISKAAGILPGMKLRDDWATAVALDMLYPLLCLHLGVVLGSAHRFSTYKTVGFTDSFQRLSGLPDQAGLILLAARVLQFASCEKTQSQASDSGQHRSAVATTGHLVPEDTCDNHQDQWDGIDQNGSTQQRLLINSDGYFISHPGIDRVGHQNLVGAPARGSRQDFLTTTIAGSTTLTGAGSDRLDPDLVALERDHFSSFSNHGSPAPRATAEGRGRC